MHYDNDTRAPATRRGRLMRPPPQRRPLTQEERAPLGTPECDAWDAQWPDPWKKFRGRIAPIVAAFKRAHAL